MNAHFTTIHGQYIFWLDTLGFACIRKYSDRVKDFFEWLESKDIPCINRITQAHIAAFFDYQQIRPNKRWGQTPLCGKTISDAHLNDYFAAVDKLCEFLHQMDADYAPVPTNCRIAIDNEERIRKIEPFTIREIKIMQSHIQDTFPNMDYARREIKHYQLKLIFILHYGCGLRQSEGFNLTANDVDFNRRTIFVRQGKGYKDRIVPMNDNIYHALQDYLYNFRNSIKCGHDRLFVQSPVILQRNLHYLQSLCAEESIREKRITFHILRHSIATHLLQQGMAVENIARFLGHNSLESTQIYTHIANR